MFDTFKHRTRLIRGLGLRGLAKSTWHSSQHSSIRNPLIFTKNTKVCIHRDAEISISGFYCLGINFNTPRAYNLHPNFFSLSKNADFVVDGGCWMGHGSWVNIDGEFTIGESYVSSNVRIDCKDNITIGNDCAISWGVEFLDTDFHEMLIDGTPTKKTGNIVVEDDCWIGKNAKINKGVRIGQGSIVASDSVVINDVPDKTLVAGVPADVISKNVSWD